MKKEILLRHSWAPILVLMLLVFSIVQPWQRYGHKVIQWDISIYYTYLPAFFIYEDIGIKKEWPVDLSTYDMWLSRSFEGKEMLKMSSGMAFMYLPFFSAAHLFALTAEEYPANGYSLPYQFALAFGAVIWTAFGLYFLLLFLKRFVSVTAAIVVLVMILVGTNLLFYTFWDGAYSHSALFALMAVLLELAERFGENPRYKTVALIGVIAGLLVLIRPVLVLHVLVLAAFFYFRVRGKITFKHVLLALLCACFVWLPQLFYWHYISGEWVYYSYGDEGFFWSDPKIIDGLFSWRKGWFVYTPIMLLIFPGLWFTFKKNRAWFWLVSGLFVLHIYVIFSWWCWWYGGSYSQRPMIEIYPLLALPIAFLVQKLGEMKWFFRAILALLITVVCTYNVFTSYQYSRSILHYDSMTREAYEAIFLNTNWPDNYDKLIEKPDYEAAIKGKR